MKRLPYLILSLLFLLFSCGEENYLFPEDQLTIDTPQEEESTQQDTTLNEEEQPQTETTQTETTQPETTQPETTQPETTQPETTQPETTQPETTQPETPADFATFSGTIWVDGVTKESGWQDVNKYGGLIHSESNTCWMATSANVLADYYRRHNIQSVPSAIAIYQDIYQYSGGDESGTYLNGIPDYVARTEVGKIYPTGLNINCLCLSNCDDIQVMSKALIENLHKGAAGIKFVWFGSDGSGHALTLWGATFEKGILTKVHVTDSDDKYEGIKEYTIKTGTDREKAVIEVTDYSPKAKLREVYIPF